MALSQSALSELLDAIRAGDGTDTVREAMALVLQELIELEATQAIGAGRYERTDERITHRNGSRTRLLSTKAGDVGVDVGEGDFVANVPAGHVEQRPDELLNGVSRYPAPSSDAARRVSALMA